MAVLDADDWREASCFVLEYRHYAKCSPKCNGCCTDVLSWEVRFTDLGGQNRTGSIFMDGLDSDDLPRTGATEECFYSRNVDIKAPRWDIDDIKGTRASLIAFCVLAVLAAGLACYRFKCRKRRGGSYPGPEGVALKAVVVEPREQDVATPDKQGLQQSKYMYLPPLESATSVGGSGEAHAISHTTNLPHNQPPVGGEGGSGEAGRGRRVDRGPTQEPPSYTEVLAHANNPNNPRSTKLTKSTPFDSSVAQWSKAKVQVWIEHTLTASEIEGEHSQLLMSGSALSVLTKADFQSRAPAVGDVLFEKLRILKEAQGMAAA